MLSSQTKFLLSILFFGVLFSSQGISFPQKNRYYPGDIIDSFNSVHVYYNGRVSNTFGRNLSIDGYNLGLKYQCVEFVKRYYYEIKNHRMPDSYGHAYMFFDTSLYDGQLNRERNLYQYRNGSTSKPQREDILVFNKNAKNPFGHVALVSNVSNDHIELIQQNVGRTSRMSFSLVKHKGLYYISNKSIMGWLRKMDK